MFQDCYFGADLWLLDFDILLNKIRSTILTALIICLCYFIIEMT